MKKLLIIPIIMLLFIGIATSTWETYYSTDFDSDDWTDVGTIDYVDTGNSRLNYGLQRTATTDQYTYRTSTYNASSFNMTFKWTTPATLGANYGIAAGLYTAAGDYSALTGSGNGFGLQVYATGTLRLFEAAGLTTSTGMTLSAATTYNIRMWKQQNSDYLELRVLSSNNATTHLNENLDVSANTYSTLDTLIFANHDTSSGAGLENHYIDNFNYRINETINFTITASNAWNGSSINTFNVTIDGTDYITTTGTIITTVLSNSTSLYNITITPHNLSAYLIRTYEDYNVSTNLEAELYPYNSINFTFKDQDTNTIITNHTIELELVSDDYANNYSTTTGNITISELISGDYRAVSISTGYDDRYYYFTLENQTTSDITIYMINSTQVQNLTVTIINQNGEEVSGIIVKSKKYYLSSNSYVVQESSETDIEGKVYFSVTSGEFWQFVVENDGTTIYTTTPQLIQTTTLTIQVIIGSEVTEEYEDFRTIDYSLSYSNSTDNFRLEYNNVDGLSTNMCLYVYLKSFSAETLLNNSCSTSGTATILLPITPVNGSTYIAKAYYTDTASVVYYLASLTHTEPSNDIFGRTGLLIQFIITMAFLMIALWNPSVAVIITPLSVMIGGLIGFHNIPTEYTAPVVIVGFILAFMMSKKT